MLETLICQSPVKYPKNPNSNKLKQQSKQTTRAKVIKTSPYHHSNSNKKKGWVGKKKRRQKPKIFIQKRSLIKLYNLETWLMSPNSLIRRKPITIINLLILELPILTKIIAVSKTKPTPNQASQSSDPPTTQGSR